MNAAAASSTLHVVLSSAVAIAGGHAGYRLVSHGPAASTPSCSAIELRTSVRAIGGQQSGSLTSTSSATASSPRSASSTTSPIASAASSRIAPARGRRVTRGNSAPSTSSIAMAPIPGRSRRASPAPGPIRYTRAGTARRPTSLTSWPRVAGSGRLDAFLPSVSPSSCVGLDGISCIYERATPGYRPRGRRQRCARNTV